MGKYSGVSPEDFVRAYQAAESVQAVADKLGMTTTAVHSRAAHYRRVYDVPLKKMVGQRARVDGAGLRNLCMELNDAVQPPSNGEGEPVKAKRVRKRKPRVKKEEAVST